MWDSAQSGIGCLVHRGIYAAYCLKTTNIRTLFRYLRCAKGENGCSFATLLKMIVTSHVVYGTHPMDFFHLRLFRTAPECANEFANSWTMHQFHRRFNNPTAARILRDKRLFRQAMAEYTTGSYSTVDSPDVSRWVAAQVNRRIVAKSPRGQAGRGVSIHEVQGSADGIQIDGRPAFAVLNELRRSGRTLLEEYVVQHDVLASFHPSSLNTVRVISFLRDDGQVDLWAAILRIGNELDVDNFSAGGVAAKVNLDTGLVEGLVFVQDPFTDAPGRHHPFTGVQVTGTQLPFWHEGLTLVRQIALKNATVRSVGWDLVFLPNGVAILEGNDNWGKTLIQLVANIKLGSRVRGYLES